MLEQVGSATSVSFVLGAQTGDLPDGSISLDIDKPVPPCLWFTGRPNGECEMRIEREVVMLRSEERCQSLTGQAVSIKRNGTVHRDQGSSHVTLEESPRSTDLPISQRAPRS